MNYKKSNEIEDIVRKMLAPEARERLNRVKLVKPELVNSVIKYLAQLYLTGRLRTKITEEQIIEILKLLNRKREFRIIRK